MRFSLQSEVDLTLFQISPLSEWADIDTDRSTDSSYRNVSWNSGYKVKAQIDPTKKIWYGKMSIPIGKIDHRAAAIGNTMRIHSSRIERPGRERGNGPRRQSIARKPTSQVVESHPHHLTNRYLLSHGSLLNPLRSHITLPLRTVISQVSR